MSGAKQYLVVLSYSYFVDALDEDEAIDYALEEHEDNEAEMAILAEEAS